MCVCARTRARSRVCVVGGEGYLSKVSHLPLKLKITDQLRVLDNAPRRLMFGDS